MEPEITLWLIEHPKHGKSIRTTPCYGTPERMAQAIATGREPQGWKETPIKLHPKAVASLRKILTGE